jgi:hypothetical protein
MQHSENHHKTRPVPFRLGEAAPCGDCGSVQWLVGRQSAECAGCGAPLPLALPGSSGAAAPRLRKGSKGRFRRAA